VQKVRAAARALREFPERGEMVPEFQDAAIRQMFVGSYRVIYRYRASIMTVIHGARFLRKDQLESD
jgi:plasmid stabilization system protein ParE